jgi:predicted enzyme related to lactoylglutathione lyase
MGEQKPTGSIVSTDLTVDDAEGVRDFYREVVGWKSAPQSMGDYDDFNMMAPGPSGPSGNDAPVAGVCHARGANANLPAQWLVYVQAEDVEASAERTRELGGAVVDGPRGMGSLRFCVIRDPAGAVLALVGPR